MSTIRVAQAGREYTLVLSNNGLRVEFGGAEVFRHWPDSTPEPEPQPEPQPEPTPDPQPEPEPNPTPTPVPQPVPGGTGVATVAELMTALGNAAPGDTIPIGAALPAVNLSGVRFSTPVTLMGGGIERMALVNCAGLRFDGVKFTPAGAASGGAVPYLLRGDAATSDVEVANCDFWGAPDAPNFMGWSLADWQSRKNGAVFFSGNRIRLVNNAALGVYFGYNLTGDTCELTGNRVAGFSADAFRASCDNLVARGNWATDAYVIDGNHPDGIQGFDLNATLRNQLWEDTIIMEYSTPTDQRGAIGASLQVIGYHNGPYANLTFRRFVASSSSHNAYHINDCPSHTAERVMMWTVPGPKGGATKLRAPASSRITDVYMDGTVAGGAPATGKPDYSKLDMFRATALRGNAMPDLRAIMGW